MTNLDKLKTEIAEMSAEEFDRVCFAFVRVKSNREYCEMVNDDQPRCISDCHKCRVKWLNTESEEKE